MGYLIPIVVFFVCNDRMLYEFVKNTYIQIIEICLYDIHIPLCLSLVSID